MSTLSPHPLAGAPFLKMNGLGNAIVVLDLRGTRARVQSQDARALGSQPQTLFDQLMVVHDPVTSGTDALIRIYNADGSEAGACGNGMRCVAWHLCTVDEPIRLLETKAGLLSCTRIDGHTFMVDMGEPRLRWDQIPLAEEFRDTRAIELQIGPIDAPILHSPSVVNMGNPHAIFWVDDPYAYDLGQIGSLLENHPVFPERANISLAAVVDDSHVTVRVWERGAGLTLACGSAACAVVVAAARKKLTGRRARVTLPGGDLLIDWRERDGHVLMTGPVAFEGEGVLESHRLGGPEL